MKDFFKQELKIGQRVLKMETNRFSYAYVGEIIGFTPKMVKIKNLSMPEWGPTNVNACNLVIVDDILDGIEARKNAPDEDSSGNITLKI